MKQPAVIIEFQERAATFIERGERGIVAMILKSDDPNVQGPFSYAREREIPSTYEEGITEQLKLAFAGYQNPPSRVIGFIVPATDYIYDVAEISMGDDPVANGWYELINGTYVLSADTLAKTGVTYYEITYTAATPEEGDSPAGNGWYELVDEVYVLSEDTQVDSEKTYYIQSYATVSTVNYASNPASSGWYETSGAAYVLSEDTFPVTGKVYYVKSSRKKTATDYSAAYEYLAGENFQYLVVPTVATDGMTSSVVAYVKDQREEDNLIKAVLPDTAADSEGIINLATPAFVQDDRTYTTEEFCSRVAGILAGTPLNMAATYASMPELTDCTRLSRSERDAAADAGQLIAYWDHEKVKLGRAINSLVTTTATKNTQFKKIKIVEAMDMIATDIRKTCEDSYIGKYANTYSNKLSLMSAIKSYFGSIQNEGVIENSFIDIDLEANEAYLKGRGIDTSQMSDADIRKATTGSHVYFTATLSMVDAIEDIVLKIAI